jgi:hypothetical protein
MQKYIFTLVMFLFVLQLSAEINIYAPTLSTPANSAVGVMPDALLNWNAVPNAWSYKVEVSKDTAFTNPIVFLSTVTATSASYLEFGTVYYWRVKAYGISDSSEWSVKWAFNTINAVTMIKPGDSTFNRPVSIPMTWTAVTGITKYEWEADSAATFDSPIHVSGLITAPATSGYTTQLHFGQFYYLRMRAIHPLDTSAWGTTQRVTTASTFALISPPAGTGIIDSSVIIDFKWATISSSYYDVALAFDSAFTSPVIFSIDSSSAYITSGIDTVMHGFCPVIAFDSVYYWSVRARNNFDTSAWMPFRTFSTPVKVKLISPADNATAVTTLPTFIWHHIIGADQYVLQYDTSATFTAPVVKTFGMDTLSFTPAAELLPFTTYYWRVKAVSTVNETPWGDERNFTTTSPISVPELTLNNDQILVYPSPSRGKLTVEIGCNQSANVNLVLSNILGQQVMTQTIQMKAGANSVYLHLDDLTNGIYVLRIQSGSQVITRKVVLDK